MSNHLIYSVILTVVFGISILNPCNAINDEKTYNSTFTFLDLENKIQQDSTPRRSRSKETYRTNDNGKKIYLSIVDGEIKKLKINGKRIPSSEYDQYAELIADFRNNTQAPEPPTPPSLSIPTDPIATPPTPPTPPQESISDGIVEALIEEGLIEDEDRYKIYLTKKKFKVNGKTQDKATHQKYINLYEELSGTKMHQNSTYKINKNSF